MKNEIERLTGYEFIEKYENVNFGLCKTILKNEIKQTIMKTKKKQKVDSWSVYLYLEFTDQLHFIENEYSISLDDYSDDTIEGWYNNFDTLLEFVEDPRCGFVDIEVESIDEFRDLLTKEIRDRKLVELGL